MKLSIIAKAIGGTLFGPDRELPPVVIDSRKVHPGVLFIAIKGEQHDGHDYLASAIQAGAVAVMAARAPSSTEEQSVSFLQVSDTIQALGALAACWRKQFSLPVLGLTGSCGKTTVKSMVQTICESQGKTLATAGNFNNEIGLPLTLLRLDAQDAFAVIEMGASGLDEISYLCSLARPTISLITNVRPAHLAGFGSIENIAKTKSMIYDALPMQGIALINLEEDYSPQWLQQVGHRQVITFGVSERATVYASNIRLFPRQVSFNLHLKGEHLPVTMGIPGQHTIINALAASAAGHAFGIPLARIVAGLENFAGVPGRLRQFLGYAGAAIIDDSYNANPGSMKAALDVLAQCNGERIFVMGDMGELGSDEISYHRQIGDYAKNVKIDKLYAVGKLSAHAIEAFGQGAQIYDSKDHLVTALKTQVSEHSTVLIKGSRSAGMEIIAKALTLPSSSQAGS